MPLEAFNIEITDTKTNTRPLELEQTAISSPKLKYNGADNKFIPLITSELTFNILVNDGTDGKFLHLYTGSETRYKAVLNDITDPLNIVQIWQGYLLPEHFNEPYTHNIFFVDFTFTDGIGLLKNKYLPDVYYTDQKTIIEIIAACLILTGNDLPINVAPAIVNAVQDLKVSELDLDGSGYITEKGKKNTAYKILEGIIKSMGCQLHQEYGAWYIIGINRKKDITITGNTYTSAGVYSTTFSKVRDIKTGKFKDRANITLIPPLKTVNISWNKEAAEEILPSDIVYQPLEGGEVMQDPHPVKYWETVGTISITLASTASSIGPDYSRLPIFFLIGVFYDWYKALPIEDPFYLSIYDDSTLPLNSYVQLIDPVYLEGNAAKDTRITIEIELIGYSVYTVTQAKIDAGDYTGCFYYELLLDGVTLVTNKSSFADAAGFEFEFRPGKKSLEIIGTLKIDRVGIETNGYLQLKLHIPKEDTANNIAWNRTGFKTVKIKYLTDDEDGIIKNRDIEFTAIEDFEIEHADDFMNISKKPILINDAVTWAGLTVSTPEETTEIVMLDYISTEYDEGAGAIEYDVIILISEADYNLILTDPNKLYKQKTGSSTWYQVSPYLYNMYLSSGYGYITMFGIASEIVLATDTLYFRVPAENYTITDKRYLRERWQRYEQPTEEIRYIDALARIYHDAVKDPVLKVDGDLYGIHLPLDVIAFDYISTRNYLLSNLEIDLTKGMTVGTIIEQINENVTDYIIE